jgi:hypothetical protein
MFVGKKERLVVLVCIILATFSLAVNTVVGCIQRANIAISLEIICNDFGWYGVNHSLKEIKGTLQEIDDTITYK